MTRLDHIPTFFVTALNPAAQKIPVSVLGATGVVGQRFVQRLVEHPFFEIRHLAASERSAGKRYDEACTWRIEGEGLDFAGLGDRIVEACDPKATSAPVVFSALDTEPARELEPEFAARGATVFSNAGAFRMTEDVPLLIPEVNPDHLELLAVQQQGRGYARGGVLCNANCTTTMLVMAIAPLHACLLYTSPSPRDRTRSRMPSSA